MIEELLTLDVVTQAVVKPFLVAHYLTTCTGLRLITIVVQFIVFQVAIGRVFPGVVDRVNVLRNDSRRVGEAELLLKPALLMCSKCSKY